MEIILLLLGLAAGTIGSLVGLGGGIIIVPALLALASTNSTFSHITPQVAVGTSLILVVFTSLSATLTYAKKKRVDFKSGWTFFIASGPGAIVGAYLTRYMTVDPFLVAFGILILLVSFMLTVKERGKARPMHWNVNRTFQDETGEIHEYGFHRLTALSISFVVGLVSGLFGIGGGALMIPMMILLFRFPLQIATATSMFVILLSSTTGSIYHLFDGNIHWYSVLWLAPGAWVGGQLGAWISSRLSSKMLLIVLRVVFVLVAIRMIANGLHLF